MTKNRDSTAIIGGAPELVAMLRPCKGRVSSPCCGSGRMFVQSERFVEAHAGRIDAEEAALAKARRVRRGLMDDLLSRRVQV